MDLKTGRLIKQKDKKVFQLIEVKDYPWLNFTDKSVVFPDNTMKSVILNKYHDPEEIVKYVRVPSEFKQSFSSHNKVMLPIDLTEDFEEAQRELIRRRKRSLMDEEEVMAMELAEIDADEEKRQSLFAGIPKRKNKNEAEQNSNMNSNMNSNGEEHVAKNDHQSLTGMINKQIQKNLVQNHENEVNKNINFSEKKNNQDELKQDSLHEVKMSIAAGFEEGKQEGIKVGEKEGHEQGMKQGYHEGYELGFKLGEEKGMLSSESKYNKSFNNISEAALRMDELKKQLLQSSQSIFIELLKICSEKILREQINISDEKLLKLINEVVKIYDSKSSINVELNSKDADKLNKNISAIHKNNNLQIKINDSLESGNFNVESDTGVSVFDLKKSVEALIDNLKKDLFEQEKENK